MKSIQIWNKYLLFWILTLMWMSSCSEKKYELQEVSGNKTPRDTVVSNVLIENYINKTYINVLGRKPEYDELRSAYQLLQAANIDSTSRKNFIQQLIDQPEYSNRIIDINTSAILKGLDSVRIAQEIEQQKEFIKRYPQAKTLFEENIAKLEALKDMRSDFNAGRITVVEVHKICVDNQFYDEINMGTENFVLSLFESFCFRQPTNEELIQSKRMVDSQSGVVFNREGRTKNDFINVFFASNDYYEGQVIDLYRRFLYKMPNSSELDRLAQQYRTNQDFSALQTSILTSNDYVGLKN
jgi:hypothetical protein